MKRYILVFAAVTVATISAAAATASIWSSGAEAGPLDVKFSILERGSRTAPEPQLVSGMGLKPDLTRLRVVTADRGRFHSRVVIAPSAEGSSVCYALLGATVTDPAMSYCYAPNGGGVPELIGGQFKPSALESVIAGRPSVQLFGVAADNVESIRVDIAGRWRTVPVANNGFYLDLPGVARDQLGVAEATLTNGVVQRYNLQTGSYE